MKGFIRPFHRPAYKDYYTSVSSVASVSVVLFSFAFLILALAFFEVQADAGVLNIPDTKKDTIMLKQ